MLQLFAYIAAIIFIPAVGSLLQLAAIPVWATISALGAWRLAFIVSFTGSVISTIAAIAVFAWFCRLAGAELWASMLVVPAVGMWFMSMGNLGRAEGINKVAPASAITFAYVAIRRGDLWGDLIAFTAVFIHLL